MASEASSEPAACPVDHKTREAWLEKSRQAGEQQQQAPHPVPSTPVGQSCDSSQISSNASPLPLSNLGTQREVSTIPRAFSSPTTAEPNARPANHERESGSDKSGMWIYPSEQMFFAAMKRKGFEAHETDMRSVVPIHNAVNEKAWEEIKSWEKGWGSDA